MSVAGWAKKLPELTKRNRIIALAVVLLLQTAFFFVFMPKHAAVIGDNVRYEYPAWTLANGRGINITYTISPDPEVREWVCSRHPDSCVGDEYPTAQYPPGYSFFIAPIYVVFGRSPLAIILAQLPLLWLLFYCVERLAIHHVGKTGYWFVMGICATYPFIARQATYIMSDHVHTVFLVASLAAISTMKVGWRRLVVFGALFAAATFVRTYSIFCLPFMFGWPRIRKAFEATPKQWAVTAAICVLPCVLWAARNTYEYGRFIPFGTVGTGPSYKQHQIEAEIGDVYTPEQAKKAMDTLMTGGGGDPMSIGPNKELGRQGMAWMKEHPGIVVQHLIERVPRLWVSKGQEGQGVSPAYPVFIVYLGGLLVLGLIGMWLRRRDGQMNFYAVLILVYWGLLVPFGGEARRTLPLRLPMLLFAAVAVEKGVELLEKREKRRKHEATPALEAS